MVIYLVHYQPVQHETQNHTCNVALGSLLMSVRRCGQCGTNVFLLWEGVGGTGKDCAGGSRARGSSAPFRWWETSCLSHIGTLDWIIWEFVAPHARDLAIHVSLLMLKALAPAHVFFLALLFFPQRSSSPGSLLWPRPRAMPSMRRWALV